MAESDVLSSGSDVSLSRSTSLSFSQSSIDFSNIGSENDDDSTYSSEERRAARRKKSRNVR